MIQEPTTLPPATYEQDPEILELEQKLDQLADRIGRGYDYIAAHGEDDKTQLLLGRLMGEHQRILKEWQARTCWQTMTFAWPYPEQAESWEPVSPIVVLDWSSAEKDIHRDDVGQRVLDVTYTRPQLRFMLQLVQP